MRIIIIGAGGFGREVASWLKDSTAWTEECEFGGFLDKNPQALHGKTGYGPILTSPDGFTPGADDRFVCAIGDPDTKLSVCASMKRAGARFLQLVHRTAVVGSSCELGEGVVLCAGTLLTADVKVGAFVALNVYATVGHDAVIGDGCTLSAHCDVTGGAILHERVFMGSHSVILPNVEVGANARIGAGTVVTRRVNPSTTVFGVPARVISAADQGRP